MNYLWPLPRAYYNMHEPFWTLFVRLSSNTSWRDLSVSDSEVDQESSLGEESSCACDSSASEGKDSSDSEPAMSEVSDQYSMLEHAYQSVRVGELLPIATACSLWRSTRELE